MKILIDCRTVRPRMSGVGVCTDEYAKAVFSAGYSHRFAALTTSEEYIGHFPPQVARVTTGISHESHPAAEWHLNAVLPRLLRRGNYDLYWGAAFLIPWVATKCRKAVTIHDLTVFDLPECYPRRFAIYLRTAISLSVRAADVVIAISESTRREIIRRFPEASRRTIVAHPGVPTEVRLVPGRHSMPAAVRSPYVLAVGHGTPRKNIIPLARLFAEGRIGRDTGHTLVVVGEGPGLPFSDRVINLSPLAQSELVPLYAEADLIVIPSLSEGFGLPMIEAMSLGCPVAAARRGSLPEVGADAAMYFDPEDLPGMTRVVNELLRNAAARADLSARGRSRVEEFSWTRSASVILDAFARVVEGKPLA